MMRTVIFILTLLLLLAPALTQAQLRATEEKKSILGIAKDGLGKEVEGYVDIFPNKVTVVTKENREKSIPLDLIESITLEKVEGKFPGEITGENYYSVRLKNSQELYRLRDKYTLNLTTSAGIVTRVIDPDAVRSTAFATTSKNGQYYIYDKNLVFGLEFKF